MTDYEKEFTLRYVFKNVEKLEREESLEESHFGAKWKIIILERQGQLATYLYAKVRGNLKLHADFTTEMGSETKRTTKSQSHLFKKRKREWDSWGWPVFIFWSFVGSKNPYLDADGNLEAVVHVKINKMTGFKRYRLMSFGEKMKPFSDVTLKVKERKFNISKLYLSSHSPVFATLFLGDYQESGKSEIELKDVDARSFQYYLEGLYGENPIDEDTVEGILTIADMFDTPLIVKKCEEFLVGKSKLFLKKKLELAGNFRLKELKKLCMAQIKSKKDIRSVIPENPSEMDPEILAELLKKSLAFN